VNLPPLPAEQHLAFGLGAQPPPGLEHLRWLRPYCTLLRQVALEATHDGSPHHRLHLLLDSWSLFRGPLMLLMFPPFLTCLLPSWEAWGKSQASHRSPRRRSPPRAPCPPEDPLLEKGPTPGVPPGRTDLPPLSRGCGHSVSPQGQWRPHQGQSSCKQKGTYPTGAPPDVIELPGFAPVSWVAHP
jgi:hypothetical protein